MTAEALRVVAVADTDSYVKWAASLIGTAPAGWAVSLVVLDTPVSVSDAQLRAALRGSGVDAAAVRRATFADLEKLLRETAPDAVLLAARGPLVRVLARGIAELEPRPVVVSGLPGISIPATRRALVYRVQCDLFVLHSHHEIRAFAELAALGDFDPVLALASLPFAHRAGERPRADAGDLVFAAQAKVPRERADRVQIAELLVRAAEADPDRRVVVKLRGWKGEHQTHAEADPYPELLDRLAAREGGIPQNLVMSTAPMSSALDDAAGLLTVSSTAAIEAVARGIPVIALDTFGVSDELINTVFAGSGLLGGEDDVIARAFRHPHDSWLRDNYFHDPSDDDWTELLAALVERRRTGLLPLRGPFQRRGGRIRDAWERKLVLGPMDRSLAGAVAYVAGVPLRAAVRAGQRVRRWATRPDTTVA
ncbi:DUF6716 putative glycosyltransferase [Microbacterium sp. SLBN-146]|uniref:DUF6716 putative glycosyltransferase n=1 Tax=Microbacterium sp. SLBN-146 TaxID=2768457 RepID=UPI001152764D|nr:DUF6716 putative glycosyltransferase [Microbacterium sp. SLBN-146]TQJ30117.1 hypothetical protein FBY39_0562 [Microbacterium sp. SLBN-146]